MNFVRSKEQTFAIVLWSSEEMLPIFFINLTVNSCLHKFPIHNRVSRKKKVEPMPEFVVWKQMIIFQVKQKSLGLPTNNKNIYLCINAKLKTKTNIRQNSRFRTREEQKKNHLNKYLSFVWFDGRLLIGKPR